MSKSTKITVISVIVAIIAFYGGMKYGQGANVSSATNGAGQFAAQGQGYRLAGGQGGRNMTMGTILSKDANSMVITLSAGGSQIVLLSDSTQVQKMSAASLNDLLVGQSVAVSGSTNSDGSLTARSVQLRPAAESNSANNPNNAQ